MFRGIIEILIVLPYLLFKLLTFRRKLINLYLYDRARNFFIFIFSVSIISFITLRLGAYRYGVENDVYLVVGTYVLMQMVVMITDYMYSDMARVKQKVNFDTNPPKH